MANTSAPASYGGLRVLVVGGGVAALEALFALRSLAGDLVDLELLTLEPRFYYRPQAVFEPFGALRVQTFELAQIAEVLGAQLTLGALASVDSDRFIARTTHGMEIEYDALLVASGVGAKPCLEQAVTFRGPADTDRISEIARDANRGVVEHVTLAIPTQRTWPLPQYELAFGLRTISDVPITVATVEAAPAAVLGPAGSDYLAKLLHRRGIEVARGFDFVTHRRPGVTIAAPELVANRIYGLPADDEGFVPVDSFCAVRGVPGVYAAGDTTNVEVKHGSIAAAQADTAALSIAARAGAHVAHAPFRPVLHARIACGAESIYVRRNLDDPRDVGTVSPDPLWSPAAKIFARYLGPALAELGKRRVLS